MSNENCGIFAPLRKPVHTMPFVTLKHMLVSSETEDPLYVDMYTTFIG